MTPQNKVLITGITAALIPVMTLVASHASARYGVGSAPAVIAGSLVSALFVGYKYLRPSPYGNDDKADLKSPFGEI
jgi:hypothetical protein